jgi:hypothetical protein
LVDGIFAIPSVRSGLNGRRKRLSTGTADKPVVVFVLTSRLRRHSEGDFHSRHNPEQTLEDSSKMRTRSSTHPKMLVPPPLQRSAVPRSLARNVASRATAHTSVFSCFTSSDAPSRTHRSGVTRTAQRHAQTLTTDSPILIFYSHTRTHAPSPAVTSLKTSSSLLSTMRTHPCLPPSERR